MEQYIDLKFKDADPKCTVEKIRGLLVDVGIQMEEIWFDSGIENCCSVKLQVVGTSMFGASGKGVTKDLALASAYGEFIERLQCGRQRFLYQSFERDPEMYMHAYAPDARYMTLQELEENGDWMDYLIRTYPFLTRNRIAKFCRDCAFANEDRILAVPFYSLFEEKYVYLPIEYVEIMYTANGCCAGNSKEEAWLHALSEIFERKCHIDVLKKQKPVPKFSREYLQQFPTVWKIIDTIEAEGDCTVDILDYSGDSGYPVAAVRLVNKKAHGYVISAAADPVLEIAIQRALTEMFQGRSLKNPLYRTVFLEETKTPIADNIVNQINWKLGNYAAEFFTDTAPSTAEPLILSENAGKTNRELLMEAIEKVRAMDRPLYIRNQSFMGFDTYKLVIPGFSETRAQMLHTLVPDYILGYGVSKTLQNIADADDGDLQFLVTYYNKLRNHRSVVAYDEIAGISFNWERNGFLLNISLAYACYKLGKHSEAISFLKRLDGIEQTFPEDCRYYGCVKRYLQLLQADIPQEKIKNLLYQFYENCYTDRLFFLLESGKTPFDEDLLQCNPQKCEKCRYLEDCSYNDGKEVIKLVSKKYAQFTEGQNREIFTIS